jgi:hypothetical protein
MREPRPGGAERKKSRRLPCSLALALGRADLGTWEARLREVDFFLWLTFSFFQPNHYTCTTTPAIFTFYCSMLNFPWQKHNCKRPRLDMSLILQPTTVPLQELKSHDYHSPIFLRPREEENKAVSNMILPQL